MTSLTGLKPSKSLLRLTQQAIHEYHMIMPGDRVLLGLSGGKDSLSLLVTLHHLQKHSPVPFELGVITIDPMVEGLDLTPLIAEVKALGMPYIFRSEPIMERAKDHMKHDSFCAWCSRMKRGMMYDSARKDGYNVLALAQHMDDLAESFLMSAFHSGQLRTMKAHYLNDKKDVRIIRPFIHVRERQTRDFAMQNQLPVIGDNCPACFSMPTQRQHMKELLASEEKDNPKLFKSIANAIQPLLTDQTYADIERVAKEAELKCAQN